MGNLFWKEYHGYKIYMYKQIMESFENDLEYAVNEIT